jgi:hypothetical protein
MLNKKIDRDDESKKSHPDLAQANKVARNQSALV